MNPEVEEKVPEREFTDVTTMESDDIAAELDLLFEEINEKNS